MAYGDRLAFGCPDCEAELFEGRLHTCVRAKCECHKCTQLRGGVTQNVADAYWETQKYHIELAQKTGEHKGIMIERERVMKIMNALLNSPSLESAEVKVGHAMDRIRSGE